MGVPCGFTAVQLGELFQLSDFAKGFWGVACHGCQLVWHVALVACMVPCGLLLLYGF